VNAKAVTRPLSSEMGNAPNDCLLFTLLFCLFIFEQGLQKNAAVTF
jgi:hypothetical protein